VKSPVKSILYKLSLHSCSKRNYKKNVENAFSSKINVLNVRNNYISLNYSILYVILTFSCII